MEKKKTRNLTHYWVETSSDNNGKPLTYVCLYCQKTFEVPNEQDQLRNYLKLKYGLKE